MHEEYPYIQGAVVAVLRMCNERSGVEKQPVKWSIDNEMTVPR